MKLFFDLLVLIAIGYSCYVFVKFLIKIKKVVILPITNEELAAIRKYPQKPIDFPTYSKQKVGIIIQLMLLLVIILFFVGVFVKESDSPFYLLMLVLLFNSNNFINVFAILEDGLLSGSHFIAWKKIKSFQFVRIDVNHPYFGFEKEVNDGYELKIKVKFYSISCIVTSDEMKEKLTRILSDHGVMKGRE